MMRQDQRGALSALHVTGVSLLHDVKTSNHRSVERRNLCSSKLGPASPPRHTSQPGGARRDRTDDLLLAKQALSQLSYGPIRAAKVGGPGKI